MIKIKNILLTLLFVFGCIENPTEVDIAQIENETLIKEMEYPIHFQTETRIVGGTEVDQIGRAHV